MATVQKSTVVWDGVLLVAAALSLRVPAPLLPWWYALVVLAAHVHVHVHQSYRCHQNSHAATFCVVAWLRMVAVLVVRLNLNNRRYRRDRPFAASRLASAVPSWSIGFLWLWLWLCRFYRLDLVPAALLLARHGRDERKQNCCHHVPAVDVADPAVDSVVAVVPTVLGAAVGGVALRRCYCYRCLYRRYSYRW